MFLFLVSDIVMFKVLQRPIRQKDRRFDKVWRREEFGQGTGKGKKSRLKEYGVYVWMDGPTG